MMHEKISHITSTDDEQLKRKLMAEILDYFQSESADISILGDLLASSNEEVSLLACSLLRELNYPQDASILSALLHQIAYGDIEHTEQVGYQALLAVIQMGSPMLAKVTTLITEKDDGEELVYDALVNVGRLFWERFEENDAKRIVHELVQFPASVIDFLVFVLRRPLKDWWEVAVLTIAAIGYPRNAEAIPTLLWTATDPNTPGTREAMDYLLSLDSSVISSYLISALRASNTDVQYPLWTSVCSLLTYVEYKVLVLCAPTLVEQIRSRAPLADWQLIAILDLLGKIGADCAVYALPEVVDALSASEEAVRRLALRVVQKIGYPQNAPALHPLFELAASGERDDPETQEVLTLLLSMGPPVLAELMRIKHEDASMEDFVETVSYQLGQFYWRQVEAGNTQLTEKVVPTLAQSPDEVLEFLMYVFEMALKDWWSIAAEVAAAIGYPRNAAVLPRLMDIAVDRNLPGSSEAVTYLRSLEVSVLVDYFMQFLFAEEGTYLLPDVADICCLLFYLDLQYARICGPAVAYLLGTRPSTRPELLRFWAMHVFKKLGPECATYALPALVGLIQHEKNSKLGRQAWRLITTFDPQTLTAYAWVLAPLKDMMSDEG